LDPNHSGRSTSFVLNIFHHFTPSSYPSKRVQRHSFFQTLFFLDQKFLLNFVSTNLIFFDPDSDFDHPNDGRPRTIEFGQIRTVIAFGIHDIVEYHFVSSLSHPGYASKLFDGTPMWRGSLGGRGSKT
jgi:hypothetical protein